MIVHEDHVLNFEGPVNEMPQVFGGEYPAQVQPLKHSQLHVRPACVDTIVATLLYITLAQPCFSIEAQKLIHT